MNPDWHLREQGRPTGTYSIQAAYSTSQFASGSSGASHEAALTVDTGTGTGTGPVPMFGSYNQHHTQVASPAFPTHTAPYGLSREGLADFNTFALRPGSRLGMQSPMDLLQHSQTNFSSVGLRFEPGHYESDTQPASSDLDGTARTATASFVGGSENDVTLGIISETKPFESIRPAVVINPGSLNTSVGQTEESSSKWQILGILYPTTRSEIEAGGHIGFGKTKMNIPLDRPCSCTFIDDPILWVLTPDGTVEGECSYPERTWIRIDSNLSEQEIIEPIAGSLRVNIAHDLDRTRRNTHPFFREIKVKVRIKLRSKTKESDEPEETDSLRTPIAAAFTYVYTWEHRGYCAGIAVSKYFSVGITNAKLHLSTTTQLGRKRRRTDSSALPSVVPSTAGTVGDIPTKSFSPRPDQATRSFNDFVLFLSGRQGNRPGLTNPTLTTDCDLEGRLRLHSISIKSGPGVLALQGASSDVWLQFICEFAEFLPILMGLEDLDVLKAVHKSSVIRQLYFFYQVLLGTNSTEMHGRENELIKSWMNVLAVVRSHCGTTQEIRFDCILILNQEVLNDVMGAEANFVPDLPVDPSDIQYLAGLIYSECLRTWKPIIGMASRQTKSWEERWIGSRPEAL